MPDEKGERLRNVGKEAGRDEDKEEEHAGE